MAFRQATVSSGTLRMEAQASLIWDPLRTFVYVRLLEGPTPLFAEPLAGATAQLFEVHDFAQAPPLGETDIFLGKHEIDTRLPRLRLLLALAFGLRQVAGGDDLLRLSGRVCKSARG